MPAMTDLDARISADPAWKAQFEANLPVATEIAKKIPLGHVSWSHWDDRVDFITILLKPPHEFPTSQEAYNYCSANTRKAEDGLGLGCCVYFYAGRVHPSYGKVALTLDLGCESMQSGEATPFDTGGLWHEKYMKMDVPDSDETAYRKRYYEDSRLGLAEWRAEFAKYLAAYFADAKDYWLGRPNYLDPENVFAEEKENGWSCWTFEVRFWKNQPIFDTSKWCSTSGIYNDIRKALVTSPILSGEERAQQFLDKALPTAPDYCAKLEAWIRDNLTI